MPMTMKGRVVLAKTHGRQEPWVFKKVDHDYFLSLHITEINGTNIITTEDAFEVLKVMFPDIRTQNKNLERVWGGI